MSSLTVKERLDDAVKHERFEELAAHAPTDLAHAVMVVDAGLALRLKMAKMRAAANHPDPEIGKAAAFEAEGAWGAFVSALVDFEELP